MRYFVVLASLFLAGCFDISQEMWITEKGGGRLQFGITLHKGLATFSREFNLSKDPCVLFFKDKQAIEQQPGVKSVQLRTQLQSETNHCMIDIVVDDFKRLNELQNHVLRDNKATRQKDEFNTSFELKNHDNGSGSFVQNIGNKKESVNNQPQSGFDKESEQLANILMGQFMGDSFWSVTLHAPGITDANGKVSEDRTTVVWKVPLNDLIIKSDLHLVMQAEFDFDLPWYKRLWKWVS